MTQVQSEVSDDDLSLAVVTYISNRDASWLPDARRLRKRAMVAGAVGRDLAFELRALSDSCFRRPRAEAYRAFEEAVQHVIVSPIIRAVWPTYDPFVKGLTPADVLETARRRGVDQIEQVAAICRRVVGYVDIMLEAREKRDQTARASRKGRTGAVPDLALQELVAWLIEKGVSANRAARKFGLAGYRNKPGGRILTEEEWLERLRRAISRHKGRNAGRRGIWSSRRRAGLMSQSRHGKRRPSARGGQ